MMTPPPPPPKAHHANRNALIFLAVAAIVVAGLYLGLHSHKYGECLNPPGPFNWPALCVKGSGDAPELTPVPTP